MAVPPDVAGRPASSFSAPTRLRNSEHHARGVMRARVERLQATEMSETPVTPQAAAPSPEAAHNPLGCRAHEVLARVGDKWSVYVIHVLGETGTLRFADAPRHRRAAGSVVAGPPAGDRRGARSLRRAGTGLGHDGRLSHRDAPRREGRLTTAFRQEAPPGALC